MSEAAENARARRPLCSHRSSKWTTQLRWRRQRCRASAETKRSGSGRQLGNSTMRSSGTPMPPIARATQAKEDPLSPGPSSTTATYAPSTASRNSRSSRAESTSPRSNGWPRGRNANERTAQPDAASVADTTAPRLTPILRRPMHTTRRGLDLRHEAARGLEVALRPQRVEHVALGDARAQTRRPGPAVEAAHGRRGGLAPQPRCGAVREPRRVQQPADRVTRDAQRAARLAIAVLLWLQRVDQRRLEVAEGHEQLDGVLERRARRRAACAPATRGRARGARASGPLDGGRRRRSRQRPKNSCAHSNSTPARSALSRSISRSPTNSAAAPGNEKRRKMRSSIPGRGLRQSQSRSAAGAHLDRSVLGHETERLLDRVAQQATRHRRAEVAERHAVLVRGHPEPVAARTPVDRAQPLAHAREQLPLAGPVRALLALDRRPAQRAVGVEDDERRQDHSQGGPPVSLTATIVAAAACRSITVTDAGAIAQRSTRSWLTPP